jgi:glycosyltransferase involved in cell wall biosynthesis
MQDSEIKRLVVVTPIKNEVTRLPGLVNSVLSQSVTPLLWVFVDDRSTDGTILFLEHLQLEHNFVKLISSGEGRRGSDLDRYGTIVKKGFTFATQQCEKNGVKPDYLAIVDADIILGKGYFKKLIDAFEHYPTIGLVSGAVFDKFSDKIVLRQNSGGTPVFTAAAMLFKWDCYKQVNGFPAEVGPENIVVLKAKNRNWKVECISDAKAFHTRPTVNKPDKWRCFIKAGETYYRLNYHPINATLTAVYFFCFGPYGTGSSIAGLAYFVGYAKSFLSRKAKIDDQEVKNYYWHSFNRLFSSL